MSSIGDVAFRILESTKITYESPRRHDLHAFEEAGANRIRAVASGHWFRLGHGLDCLHPGQRVGDTFWGVVCLRYHDDDPSGLPPEDLAEIGLTAVLSWDSARH